MADLQQELAFASELQDVIVFLRAPARPNIVLLIDKGSVPGGKPLIALSRAAPCLKKLSIAVEFQNRRRRNTAFRLRRTERRGFFPIGNRSGPMKDPNVIMGIGGDSADLSVHPFVR